MIIINYSVFLKLCILEVKNNCFLLLFIFFKMAWYQRIYFIITSVVVSKLKLISFKLFLNIILLSTILIFLIYTQNSVQCFNLHRNYFFQNHIVGNTPVHFYKNIDHFSTLELIKRIKQSDFNNLNYSIYQPTQFSINNLPRYHPFRHYHLNILEFNNVIPHIYINIPFSSQNFNNCHLLTQKSNLLLNSSKPQFIASNFYFYNIHDIKKYLELSQFEFKYLDVNKKEIEKHITNILDKYKL